MGTWELLQQKVNEKLKFNAASRQESLAADDKYSEHGARAGNVTLHSIFQVRAPIPQYAHRACAGGISGNTPIQRYAEKSKKPIRIQGANRGIAVLTIPLPVANWLINR